MELILNIEFAPEEEVYLIADSEQKLRFITGIMLRNGGISYELSCAEIYSAHYGFEISRNKKIF